MRRFWYWFGQHWFQVVLVVVLVWFLALLQNGITVNVEHDGDVDIRYPKPNNTGFGRPYYNPFE